MSSLFLVPVDEPSFQATLKEPIDLSDCGDRPNDVPRSARVWGVRTDQAQGDWTRNRRYWNSMESGDRLVFYRNSRSLYDAIGRVGTKFETEFVRDRHWNGGPAITVYTVEDYDDSIDLDRENVNALLGYKENFWPQGLWKVSDDRPTGRLIQRLRRDT